MEKAFISWSGGKDCCMATYQAKQQGLEIAYLLNMVTQDKKRSCSHGIATQWIRKQAEAIGIPLLQFPTADDNYQSIFIDALHNLFNQNVSKGVFGDIDFEPHREWIEKVCVTSGITPILPLWGRDQTKIMTDFIELRFQATVIATRADLLGEEWLGRRVDKGFLNNIGELDKSITPCGEAGEFHTRVVDGPIFKKRLEIREATPEKRGEHWFWDIKQIELVEKGHGGSV